VPPALGVLFLALTHAAGRRHGSRLDTVGATEPRSGRFLPSVASLGGATVVKSLEDKHGIYPPDVASRLGRLFDQLKRMKEEQESLKRARQDVRRSARGSKTSAAQQRELEKELMARQKRRLYADDVTSKGIAPRI
jgi:hypothetical protein